MGFYSKTETLTPSAADRSEHSATIGRRGSSVVSGYRYYSPELGRWVNRDPMGEEGALLVRSNRSKQRPVVSPLVMVAGAEKIQIRADAIVRRSERGVYLFCDNNGVDDRDILGLAVTGSCDPCGDKCNIESIFIFDFASSGTHVRIGAIVDIPNQWCRNVTWETYNCHDKAWGGGLVDKDFPEHDGPYVALSIRARQGFESCWRGSWYGVFHIYSNTLTYRWNDTYGEWQLQ